jgi:hypothetical protein
MKITQTINKLKQNGPKNAAEFVKSDGLNFNNII